MPVPAKVSVLQIQLTEVSLPVFSNFIIKPLAVIDISHSPIFSRDRRDIVRLTVVPSMSANLIFKCTAEADVEDYSCKGRGLPPKPPPPPYK